MKNKKIKKHLFLIHTEFHLLMLLSLIENNINKQDEITIMLSRKSDSNRFRFELNLKDLNFNLVELLDIDEKKSFIPLKAKHQINELLEIDFDSYYSFLEHTGLNYLFVSRIASSTKICLLPEGTRPYISFNKAAIGSRIRQTLNNYKFLYKTGFPWYKLRIMSYKHGYLPETNEIWIENKDVYPNYNHRKLRKVSIFLKTNQNFEKHKELFKFNIEEELNINEDIILYLNHPYVVAEVYHLEIEILQKMRVKFPEKPIVIKLHPGPPSHQIERFKTIENIVLNTSTKPAELFIQGIKNSVVISFWSASLMMPNETCQYYWLYPLILKNIPEMYWWSMENPTSHIEAIDNLAEIN